MHRCGFLSEDDDYCYRRTVLRYPGGSPENGPARECCPLGHATCYSCGAWFQALTRTEAWTDEETGIEIPESIHESEWCPGCDRIRRD
jgi:hypothetical protein